jgi:hypothetical protein
MIGILDGTAMNQVLPLLDANQMSKKRTFEDEEIVTFLLESDS